MNGTLHTVDGRYALRFERRFAHPVEKVWSAITDPAHLVHWFPAEVEMEFAIGGKVRWVFQGSDAVGPEGIITEFDPPRLLEYTLRPHVVGNLAFGEATLRFELYPDHLGCRLVFTNTFDDRPSAASFATGWHVCLGALEMVLDGKPVEVSDRYAELHDAYVEAFGLAEGSVHETADGWTVRFERQLTRPVDKVWAMLTGLDAPTPDAAELVVGGPAPLPATNEYVSAGVISAVDPRALLEYYWQFEGKPAGRVRWEFSEGPGGARVVLTHTLPRALRDQRSTALAAWHTHLEVLAAHLRGQTVCPWPRERTEELRKHYADVLR